MVKYPPQIASMRVLKCDVILGLHPQRLGSNRTRARSRNMHFEKALDFCRPGCGFASGAALYYTVWTFEPALTIHVLIHVSPALYSQLSPIMVQEQDVASLRSCFSDVLFLLH